MNHAKPASLIQTVFLCLLALVLSACGTNSGEENTLNPQNRGQTTGEYTGPAPATNDVNNFMVSLWSNIGRDEGRCAGCHNSRSGTAQQPLFADWADVNDAYAAVGRLVDLDDPAQSLLVTKVAEGHNCWHNSPADCAATMTTWISNWAGGAGGSVSEVSLRAPEIRDVSASKAFPESPATYQSTVYPLLTEYCSRCHVEGMQTPFLGSANVNASYAAAQSRINLVTPSLSRLVERLRNDFHNCWDNNCGAAAQEMQDAITAFSTPLPLETVDPALVVSKALRLSVDGIAANTGGRYEDNIIAKYEFKTGEGYTAYDTSGVEPALDLTLSGNTEWVGGWGVRFGATYVNESDVRIANGKAQGTTTASRKLYDLITATGEYTLEAWVVPGNVTQEEARIITYSGSSTDRNLTLGQTLYNYDVLHRSSTSNQNVPFSTADAAQRLQATLQHVVVTYSPGEGRRIYVNGEFTEDDDPDGPGNFTTWSNNYALILGNEADGRSLWQGTIRMAAIHNRALNAEQITQNYEAGVGEKFFMLFSIADLINIPESFIVFEVSQFDSYSYLFTEPFFVSLRDSTEINDIPIQGLQIGINGDLPPNGQAYKNLDFMLDAPNYTSPTYVPISPAGTILPLERGPDFDEMFLSFERIGSHENVIVEALPPAPPAPADSDPVSDIGLKTFDEINASMSMITGIPKTNAAVANTFNTVRQQLPTVEKIDGFVSAHQMGITQLAIQYCDELVDDTTARAAYFPGFNFGTTAQSAFDVTNRARIIDPLLARGLGNNLTSQPADADVREELNDLMDRLLECGGACNTTAQTANVVKASCAAVLGSAAMLIQ